MSAEPRFICDDHCGRLARWLRFLGYDCAYDSAIDDGNLLKQAAEGCRTILTRDTGMASKAMARGVIRLQSDNPLGQLRQVLAQLGLTAEPRGIGTRCSVCNGLAEPVALEQVVEHVPPYVQKTRHSFRQCADCRRVYWHGTHVDRMISRLRTAGVLSEPG